MSEVDQQSGHLSDFEVEQYGEPVDTAKPEGGDRPDDKIDTHLADCPACRNRVLASQRARLALSTDLTVNTPPRADRPGPGPDCPSEDDLRDLAAAVGPPESGAKLTQHAAQCDHCGPLLRMYTEDFSDDLSADDQALLGKLKSSSSAWQEKLVEKMLAGSDASSARAAKKPFPWRWVLAPSALVACAAIAFAFWYSQRETPEKVEKLLAQAYTEQRTIEMRFHGAAWGPMRIARGSARSHLNRPSALLDAEWRIAHELEKGPRNPAWIERKALANLLEGQFDDAIEDLEALRAQKPNSSTVLTLLGIARYERAQSSRSGDDQKSAPQNLASNDCVIATENLSRALDISPGDPVVLYNLALAHTCVKAYRSAIEDWENYLKLDNASPWAGEARKHLAELQLLLRSYDRHLAEPLILPAVLKAVQNGNGSSSQAIIDSRIEEYFETTVKDWLPALSRSLDQGATEPQSRSDLSLIARAMRALHGDSWLEEILALAPSVDVHRAFNALSLAVEANESGNPELALRSADQAEVLFRRINSPAGVARAKFEEIYALRRAAKPCYSPAMLLASSHRLQKYKWILIQSHLELASCAVLAGKLDQSQRFASDATRLAERYRLPVLHLRGLAFKGSLQRSKGAFLEAWSSDLSGLTVYWRGSFPPIRAYLFYTDLGFLAEDANLWHVAYSMAKEAVQQISKTPNASTQAMARIRLANLALMINQTNVAEQEYKRADAIFAALADVDSTRTYRADAQLGLAKVDVSRGELSSAAAQLDAIHSQIALISSHTVVRRYHFTLAELDYRQGKRAEAKESLWKAVEIGESELASLDTERDRLRWERENGKSYRLLVKLELEENRPEEALELWEWYRAAAFRYDRGSMLAIRSVLARARVVMQRESLITYAILPGGVSIWLSDNRGLTALWVPADPEALEQQVKEFAAACADQGSDLSQLNIQARRLYQLLIKPIAKLLQPQRTLVLESDDLLYPLPFNALLGPQNAYLGASFRLVFSPGIAYRSSASPLGKTVQEALVVGSTATSADAPTPLPEVEGEARAIAGYFQGPELLMGKDAQLRTVLRDLHDAVLFHFAGHGVSLDYDTHAGLLLYHRVNNQTADDTAVLDAEGLESTRLPHCQLVVLSACSTAKSTRGGFADPDSLVRAFLRSGARHVVASHWAVDSAVTIRSMELFYDSLHSGKSVSMALQETENEVRRKSPHPYYWASFNAFGTDDSSPELQFAGQPLNTRTR